MYNINIPKGKEGRKMAEVTYEIKQNVAVLSDRGKGWKKELNLVSWNGGMPKVDIREWNSDHSSMKKGITLSRREFEKMAAAIKEIDATILAESHFIRMDGSSYDEALETGS